MAETVIRDAVKHALVIAKQTDKTRDFSGEIENADVELEHVREAISLLLPIEARARMRLQAREKELLRESVMKANGAQGQGFLPFPLEALTWRNKQGYPRLAVFSLTNPKMSMGIVRYTNWSHTGYRMAESNPQGMPKAMRDSYKDVMSLLKNKAKVDRKSYAISVMFEGVIPTEVKQAINEAKPAFNSLWVVAEAKNWSLKASEPTVIKRSDPIVVGYDGFNYWIVAAFDTTPIEKYVESMGVKAAAVAKTE